MKREVQPHLFIVLKKRQGKCQSLFEDISKNFCKDLRQEQHRLEMELGCC